MTTLFIFRRDLRLYDNTSLILADINEKNIIPIFIFDPHQIERKNKSDSCVQFMIESLLDLKKQLKYYGSDLHTFYGEPWNVIEKIIKSKSKSLGISSVYMNVDYTKYSKYRDKKIYDVCKKYDATLNMREDLMLNNVDTVLTSTGKFYEKFTPYYENAKRNKIRLPQKHLYKHLIKENLENMFDVSKWKKLYVHNENLYTHGGRENGVKLLKNVVQQKKYNETKNYPEYDTTLLSAHNKFGTLSIREVYHTIKKILGSRNELLRQLYWRDFYYVIGYNDEQYYDMSVGSHSNMKWNNSKAYYNKLKSGSTGIPMIDAGVKQLATTGWIHNRNRLNIATMLNKVLQLDWRIGEKLFKKFLIDYDITQNIMNWYWISSETPFSNPNFRTLNPIVQASKYDIGCTYSSNWIEKNKCIIKPFIDVPKMIEYNMKRLKKYRNVKNQN